MIDSGVENLTALDELPQGARLLSFVGRTCEDDWASSRLEHLPRLLERKLTFSNDQWSMASAQLLSAHYKPARGLAHAALAPFQNDQ